MMVTYTNLKDKIYYLHKGKSKNGNDRYYFSPKSEGDICEIMPDGYEIYENPNGQVFIRKIQKKIILDSEIELVDRELKKASRVESYRIDIKKNRISIYTAEQSFDTIANIMGNFGLELSQEDKNSISKHINYSSELRFMLVDKKERLFLTERYNYLGRIDDWMSIGYPDKLDVLVKEYIQHLGKESFFELY